MFEHRSARRPDPVHGYGLVEKDRAMTRRTALVISGDSEGAQRAVADLDRAIEQSEGEARAYA